MAGKTAFPDLQDIARMSRVIIPLIEEDMAQSGAHDGGNDHIGQELVQKFIRNAFFSEEAPHKEIAKYEATGEKQLIESQRKRAQGNPFAHIPGDGDQFLH